MSDSIQKIANIAVEMWAGAANSLRLVGISANYVFSFVAAGETRFLRLTPESERTINRIAAELDFIVYLRQNGVNAMLPIASSSGRLIEEIDFDNRRLFACVFEAAAGEQFTFNSAESPKEHFRLRGRTLGEIHNLSRNYNPANDCRRFMWDEDVLLIETERFLPESETIVWKEFLKLKEQLQRFPKSSETFGLIHGDLGETNFLCQNGRLNVFDFDDSCYHWFVYDLAISIYPHGWRKEGLQLLDSLLEGYGEKTDLNFTLVEITIFCRWRLIYMFLVYARKLGFDDLMPQQIEWFRRKRENIARGYSWQIN
jgi:Ser/Thr protein kinase RdoA (MazF antagonist)